MERGEQQAELGLLGRLIRLAGIEYPNDPALRARIRSYELAAGMQTGVPETLQMESATRATQRLDGMDNATTRPFRQLRVAARRLVERGVRFVQLFHGGGAWDAHGNIRGNHGSLSAQVEMPIAGLLKDLKRRGLLSASTPSKNRHYVTDIHATVIRQLGLNARRLEIPGRRRLNIDYGQPIREILA